MLVCVSNGARRFNFDQHTLCMRAAKALTRLRDCTGSHEPSLLAYAISIDVTCCGSNALYGIHNESQYQPVHTRMLNIMTFDWLIDLILHVADPRGDATQ